MKASKLTVLTCGICTALSAFAATDCGVIVTDKNLGDYAKVANGTGGAATITIADTNGTANAVTVYNKATLDSALSGKAASGDVTALQNRATALETATNNLTTAVGGKVSKSGDTMTEALNFGNRDNETDFTSIDDDGMEVECYSGGNWHHTFYTFGAIAYKGHTLSFPQKNGTFAMTSDIPSSYAWSSITSKPTTISGYGITDAKINNGTITLGSNSITPVTSESDPTALKPSQLKVNGTAMTTSSAAVELGGYYIAVVDGKPHLMLR